METKTYQQVFEGVYGYHKPYNHMTADLNGRVALITGASGMIGGATAELMAASGAKIAIWDINDEAGAERVAKIEAAGGEAKYYHVNLVDRADVKAVFPSGLSRTSAGSTSSSATAAATGATASLSPSSTMRSTPSTSMSTCTAARICSPSWPSPT